MRRPFLLTAAVSQIAPYGLLRMPPALAQSCSSFNSCAEAMRSLRSGDSRIDGDGDGNPCESL